MNLWQRVRSAAGTLWSGKLSEATSEEVFGRPVGWWDLFGLGNRRPAVSIWNAHTRKEKNATLRTLQDHDRARNQSRVLAETNPTAIGLLQRLQAYNVGKGSSTEVHAVKEDAEPPKRLAAKVRDFLKAFKKVNGWLRREKEMVWRLHVDGEFFLRFFPTKEGITHVRFIEPACIRPPMGEDSEGEWSFGIRTPEHDSEAPTHYCLHDFRTGQDEIVEAHFILHAKINAQANQKRGVPSLYAVEEELQGTAKLRWAVREGEKNRACITYFRQHDAASKNSVDQAFRGPDAARMIQMEGGPDGPQPSTVYVETLTGPSVIDIPKGLNPLPPPASPNSASSSTAVDQGNEAIAARFGVPVWIVSGKSEGGNFAQSLIAESPFTVSLQDSQADLAEISDACQTKALEIGAEQGLMPQDVLGQIDLLVTFPSPVSRNRLEETQRRKILRDANVLSEFSWGVEEGLDPDKQRQQMREERADPILALPTRVPSVPVDPRTGLPYNPPAAPAGANGAATNGRAPSSTPSARYAQLTKSGPLREQLREQIVEAVARMLVEGDWSEDLHPRDEAGKFGEGGGSSAAGSGGASAGGSSSGGKGGGPPAGKSEPGKAAGKGKGTPLERMGLLDRIRHGLAELGLMSKPTVKGAPWKAVEHLSVADRLADSLPRDAFVQELESDTSRQGKWRQVARDNGMPVEEMRAKVADNLNKMIEPLAPRMRFRSLDRLGQVLDSGEFKNQFFPGVTSEAALNDKKGRALAEEKSMGVPADAPHQERPVYGYLADDKIPQTLQATQAYGDFIVRFKGQVKDKMTVSYGDSLMGGINKEFVSCVPGQAHPESIDPSTIARRGMDVTSDFEHFDQIHRGYIEAHLHSGTKLSDVESIEFPKHTPPPEELQAKMKALGIPWSSY